MAEAAESFHLNILIGKETESVNVYRNWRVYDLKELIGIRRGVEPNNLHVIFAGAEIADDFAFRDCDVTSGSVLHVIIEETGSRELTQQHSVASLGPMDDKIEVQSNERHRARFYVYCKSVCDKVCVGKLRVRCKSCRSQGFTVTREPGCWNDVLVDSQIEGSCLSEHCPGTVAKFFFKCGEHSPMGSDKDESFPLSMVRTNIADIPCLVCSEIQPILLVFPCAEMHTICLDCFSEYCRTQIGARRFVMVDDCSSLAYTIVCPGNGENCDSAYVDEPHHFQIPGREFYKRYQRYAAEDIVLQDGGVLCPGVDCGNGIISPRSHRQVTCDTRLGGCGLVFCRNCLSDFHSGTCAAAEERLASARITVNPTAARRAQWDRSSRVLIKQIAKPCPRCRAPIEKSGGCNHMICTSCRFHFCWLCLIEWNRTCMGEHWFWN